jgi:hypothetical protein
MESTRPHLKIVLATITTVKNGSKWSFHSAATLADVSSKIGALATGEATERTAHVIDGLSDRDLEAMPLDQLLALRAQVERGKR